jgi:hypothetical protein
MAKKANVSGEGTVVNTVRVQGHRRRLLLPAAGHGGGERERLARIIALNE